VVRVAAGHQAGSGSSAPGDAVAAADREDELSQAAGSATGPALVWVTASLTARTLVAELRESTAHTSELVAAVKEYTHMDRAAVEDVDLHEGIESTLTMLGHRLKHGRIAHRIVTGRRGDITVRSQPGSTTFTVSLPVAAAAPA
jgi:hypothetical protein